MGLEMAFKTAFKVFWDGLGWRQQQEMACSIGKGSGRGGVGQMFHWRWWWEPRDGGVVPCAFPLALQLLFCNAVVQRTMQESSPFLLLQPTFSDSWDFTNQDCANGKYRGVVVPSPVSHLQGSWVGIDVTGSPLLCHQLWLLLI